MAFRQFKPEISHQPFSILNKNNYIQNLPSFVNNFGINLNPSPISRIIQHNNETSENIKTNKHLIQRSHINIQTSNQLSYQKVSKLNDRQRQYKRSTNNSHKKFICIARRLLMRFLKESEKKHFDNEFQAFKNSRVYYFIILAHAKMLLSPQNLRDFSHQFLLLMSNKIELYKKQISQTDNHNFINYRYDQIADIQYAIQAFDLYFKEQTQQAIEVIYKREKATVLKKHQYQQTIKIINQLQRTLTNQQSDNNNLHNVIILKKNNPYEENDQHIPPSKQNTSQQINNFYPFSFESKQEAFVPSEIQCKNVNKDQMILISLQNSYPVYDYFYEIMFPYKIEPPLFSCPPISYVSSYFTNNQINLIGKQQKLIKRQIDDINANKLFMSKTRSDEEMIIGISSTHND